MALVRKLKCYKTMVLLLCLGLSFMHLRLTVNIGYPAGDAAWHHQRMTSYWSLGNSAQRVHPENRTDEVAQRDGDRSQDHVEDSTEARSAARDAFVWNESGCQSWPRQHHESPRGLMVTLVLTPDDSPPYVKVLQRLLCRSLVSQLTHVLGPQKWDMLLLIGGDHFQQLLSFDHVSNCLNLTIATKNPTKFWHNLDGTNLTTTEYRWNNQVSVFFSHVHLQWPQYIQNDMSILKKHIEPQNCDAPKSYIQGTRWYSNEMLHLAILQNYHWFIKIDLDVFFVKTVEWNLLHDLQTRNSLFAHTAGLDHMQGHHCASNIVLAMQHFTQAHNSNSSGNHQYHYCDDENPTLKLDMDHYYTNFIMGRVDFWTQPRLLELGRYLSEYPQGFFEYRWTDQIFWGQALGMLVPVNEHSVTDYSEMRCSVESNCWQAVFYYHLYGYSAHDQCDNDAYFMHTKNYNVEWNQTVSHEGNLWQSDTELHILTYKNECTAKISPKQKKFDELKSKAKQE